MEMDSDTRQTENGSDGVPELGSKDVSFLRAIREINDSFETAGEGIGAPATTGRIRKVAGLDSNEVQHRLKRSERVENLIEVYPAPVYENNQQGPKSAELTAAGEQALDRITSGELSITGVATPEDIDGIREELVEIRETLTEIEENPTGGLDESEAENLDALKTMMVTFQNAFEELGVDLDEHRPDSN